MPVKKTECECEEPGWCERHQCQKHPHFYKLCQSRPDYFQLWEEGRGPGQNLDLLISDNKSSVEPGIIRKLFNFSRAVARHVATGRKNVSEEEYEQRLLVCQSCEKCDTTRMICKHKTCGCFLRVKALWQSEKCPLEKWENVELKP